MTLHGEKTLPWDTLTMKVGGTVPFHCTEVNARILPCVSCRQLQRA